ncbi:MAG: site-2 protease family protein, partial [Clostridia bacterium]|nr:site-2 protease family protein [Clostridia bacterium]
QFGVVLLGRMSFDSDTQFSYMLATVGYIICLYLVQMNLGLGLFNLIPIPPLDGSKVLNAILPQRLYFKIMEYERYGFILLIVLINLPFFSNLLFGAEAVIMEFYETVIGWIIH